MSNKSDSKVCSDCTIPSSVSGNKNENVETMAVACSKSIYSSSSCYDMVGKPNQTNPIMIEAFEHST